MGIRGRYNFLNMSRYGSYSEQSYRNNFEKEFNFLAFNVELINQSCSRHLIIAFDPSYIPKSGKHTDHLGWFWSGTSGKALKRLEIGGLAVIDIDNNTAMSLEAIQTPGNKEVNYHRQRRWLEGLAQRAIIPSPFVSYICSCTKIRINGIAFCT